MKICTPVLSDGKPDKWVYNILRAKRGLILIDGIDEVPRARREAVREWIHQIREAYPENRTILTSRPTAVQSSFDLLERDPLRKIDILEYPYFGYRQQKT